MATKTIKREMVFDRDKIDVFSTIKQIRRYINKQQDSTYRDMFNFYTNVLALFNLQLGIIATCMGMSASEAASQLEACEDFYTELEEDFASNSELKSVTVTQTFKGTYQGKNKEYVYKGQTPERTDVVWGRH